MELAEKQFCQKTIKIAYFYATIILTDEMSRIGFPSWINLKRLSGPDNQSPFFIAKKYLLFAFQFLPPSVR